MVLLEFVVEFDVRLVVDDSDVKGKDILDFFLIVIIVIFFCISKYDKNYIMCF